MTRERSIEVRLRSGLLRVAVARADLPLESLCGYASRRSRKRGFVFVSKVLGKHYPVRPGVIAHTHALLAAKLNHVSGPAVAIALCETATGLGQGVYEDWLRNTSRRDALFLHSTRYCLRHPLAFEFDEAHSHAARHLLYRPLNADAQRIFASAKTLVLIDDEMSTGRTLANLAAAYRRVNANLKEVLLVCLTDWLNNERRGEIERRIGLPVRWHSLLQGSFEFQDDSDFDPGPTPLADGTGEWKDHLLAANFGRLGCIGALRFDLDAMADAIKVEPGKRVLVLGSGEFAHPPFLLARLLEERGLDVHYQSTTRSPLLADGDITSKLEFADNYHDGIANYLYNFADRTYDRVLIGYETQPLPPDHSPPGQPVFFSTAAP